MPEKRALALFDFDGTLLPGDSIVRYVKMAAKEGLISPASLAGVLIAAALALGGTLSDEQGKSRALSFRARMTPEARRSFDERFYRAQIEPLLYALGMERLREHKARGDAVVLVTASPSCYMEVAAQRLGVALLATPADGAGRVIGKNVKGEEKPRRVLAWLSEQPFEADLAASHSYGDSGSDLPMLRMVGHPLRVNPKRALRRESALPTETWA